MHSDSALEKFSQHLQHSFDTRFTHYTEFHRWCCDNPERFWSTLLKESAIDFSGDPSPTLIGNNFVERQFFPNLQLNYAKALLSTSISSPDAIAVTVISENGVINTVTRNELIAQSMAVAAMMLENGVESGDRVVAIARNSIESIEACLGAAAIGASWSSVSPELGSNAVLERFGQLEPCLLFADISYSNNGVEHNIRPVINELLSSIPSIKNLVLLSTTTAGESTSASVVSDKASAPDLFPDAACVVNTWRDVQSFPPVSLDSLGNFPFDHPLFVMFSSGTTGAPKCIVHGAGGTLLEHIKEHRLHSNLTDKDVLLFQTSTGWMMWNWQLSALAGGTPIVLYDGSVSYPDKTSLLQVIAEQGVTVFGTSPAYIQFLIESGITPRERYDFPALRAIQSTGSVLYEKQFQWIAESFKDVPVQSVSGGTDMIGCLVLGHPDLPVEPGDSQCISLGIDVQVKTESGVQPSGTGELVVTRPFPSQPVFFWNDADKKKQFASYFKKNPGVWTHGDEIRLTAAGSPRILGRSDGTMNIRGVRIGPAEVLTIVNQVEGVRESMAIEQASPREPGGTRLVLLLVMNNDTPLERSFVLQLKKKLANEASRLHVPVVVEKVSALPRTHNGKLSEKAARDAVNGLVASNQSALVNPEILKEIQQVVPPAPQ